MGYDIYLSWKGMTESDKQKQFTGFSIVHGHVGYLREAYHGEPYATKVLLKEAHNIEDGKPIHIPAKTLRTRLPANIKAAIERAKVIYKDKITEKSDIVKSFIQFVELAEKLEKEGKNPKVAVR